MKFLIQSKKKRKNKKKNKKLYSVQFKKENNENEYFETS